MVTPGTGIGVAAIVDGNVFRGASGAAGVLGGHLRLRLGGRACMCGRRGCAEAEASTWALAERARESETVEVGDEPLDSERLAQIIDSRPAFEALWDGSLEAWSALIVEPVHAYDPERVVLGGGIARNRDVVDALARALVADPWTTGRSASIAPTQFGDDAAG